MHFVPYAIVCNCLKWFCRMARTLHRGKWSKSVTRHWTTDDSWCNYTRAILRAELNFCSAFQGIESPEACKWKTWNSTLSNRVRDQVPHYNYNSRVYCSEWACSNCNKKSFYCRITAEDRHTNPYDIVKGSVTYKSIVSWTIRTRKFRRLSWKSVYFHNFGRQRNHKRSTWKTSCYFEIRTCVNGKNESTRRWNDSAWKYCWVDWPKRRVSFRSLHARPPYEAVWNNFRSTTNESVWDLWQRKATRSVGRVLVSVGRTPWRNFEFHSCHRCHFSIGRVVARDNLRSTRSSYVLP